MKKILTLIPIPCVLFSLFLVQSCSQPEQTNKTSSTVQADSTAVAVLENQNEQSVLNNYVLLKNSLVAADSANATIHATNLVKDLDQGQWKDVSSSAEKVSKAKTLKDQRSLFTQLSEQMISKITKAKFVSGNAYVQHCPMANNGDGGDWISFEKNIRNPYYGDEMLECGAVVETITAK